MITQSFLYNAVFFAYTLVLTKIYGVPASDAPIYLIAFCVGNLTRPLTIGRLFDTIGRKQMIVGTYLLYRRRCRRGLPRDRHRGALPRRCRPPAVPGAQGHRLHAGVGRPHPSPSPSRRLSRAPLIAAALAVQRHHGGRRQHGDGREPGNIGAGVHRPDRR
jgi:hypothetical protein